MNVKALKIIETVILVYSRQSCVTMKCISLTWIALDVDCYVV